MDRKTKIKVFISCMCFLGMIYGLASLDQEHRKQVEDEIATMAEDATSKPVMAKEKIMYLTFDDGPSKHTQEVLDLLNKYSIKATFFVTGENAEYSSMIKTIHEQGHTLGIHTYSHDYAKIYTSVDAYFQDIEKVSNLIKSETGVDTTLLRFPGGSSNTVSKKYCDGIMTTLAKAVEEQGYTYYDWNAHNGDGDPSISADALYNQTMREIEGKDHVVLLLHDGAGNQNTIDSLDRVLIELIQQGWTFKVIEPNDQDAIVHHHIAN